MVQKVKNSNIFWASQVKCPNLATVILRSWVGKILKLLDTYCIVMIEYRLCEDMSKTGNFATLGPSHSEISALNVALFYDYIGSNRTTTPWPVSST